MTKHRPCELVMMDHGSKETRIKACCQTTDGKKIDAYLNLASFELMMTERGHVFLLQNQGGLHSAVLYHQGLASAGTARHPERLRPCHQPAPSAGHGAGSGAWRQVSSARFATWPSL